MIDFLDPWGQQPLGCRNLYFSREVPSGLDRPNYAGHPQKTPHWALTPPEDPSKPPVNADAVSCSGL